jgi:hypothetical protein
MLATASLGFNSEARAYIRTLGVSIRRAAEAPTM